MSILQNWFRWGPTGEDEDPNDDDDDDPTNTSDSSIGRSSSSSSADDDDRAQRWLTQFPAYGTNKASFDFLEDEEGDQPNYIYDDPNHFTSSPVDHLGNPIPDINHNTNPSNNSNADSRNVTNNTGDWPAEDEEAHLWKVTTLPSTTTTNTNSTRSPKHQQTQQPQLHRLILEPDVIIDETMYVGTADLSPRGASSSGGTASVVVLVDESKQHWMPDQLCKQCYNCEATFTFYRRRHHCRLCGQVFCNVCSGYFIKKSGGNITLRSCRLCYEQLQQQPVTAAAAVVVATSTTQQQQQQQQQTQQQQQQQITTTIKSPETPISVSPLPVNTTKLEDAITINDNKMPPPPSSLILPLLYNSDGTQPQLGLQNSGGAPSRLLPQYVDNGTEFKPNGGATSTGASAQEASGTSTNEDSPDQLQSSAMDATTTSETSMVKPTNTRRSIITTSAVTAAAAPSTAMTEYQEHEKQLGNRHLGLTAACHLETLAESLLQTDAPLLWNKSSLSHRRRWISALMTQATKCCATVNPQVKKGDSLDLRPYCKIKVIPGGSVGDCAYLSGVMFRKTVSHKRMAKELTRPRLLLLSGGIEFTRTENRIASLETLLEQEDVYTEILVSKILKLQPQLVLVGKSVSRKAQELFLKAKIVLIQQVKATLLSRISRQTGATIISSTDLVMNQFGPNVLGVCQRFRLVTFRDNETWIDDVDDAELDEEKKHDDDNVTIVSAATNPTRAANVASGNHVKNLLQPKRVHALLADKSLKNHERQAALAAKMLGQGVMDGSEAVQRGLAKRGVAQTYVMIEGCPKHLGCTVVLRGASRAALKQVKVVFRFLVNVAYNLKLETSYLRERCARIRPDFEVKPEHLFSSSLCVDYGPSPAKGRLVRPWNGGNTEAAHRSLSGRITAFDHQSILITSIWMTETTQCCPAEVKGICYYSLQDVSLGQFLRDSCFNLSLKCQNPSCKKSVLNHTLSFVHNDGLINIAVDRMEEPLPPAPIDGSRPSEDAKEDEGESDEVMSNDNPIATWTYCKNCAKVVTPLVYISENTWKYSFGKFLESFFYNRDAIMNAQEHGCSCPMQPSAILYFGCGKLAARFTYESVKPFGVFVRRNLPIDPSFHRTEAVRQLELISMASSELFVAFDKHIEKISREARSLLGSAANRPEHLQTVISELNRIGSEVDHAAKTLQEKIASVSDKCRREGDGMVNEALFRFPWFSRRYLFMLTSAWNERLSAAGQAIVAMKKLASGASQRNDGVMGQNVPTIVGDPSTDELMEGMKRLRQLNEMYSGYNVTDLTTVLPTIPGRHDGPQDEMDNDDDFDDGDGVADLSSDGLDADVLASRRRLYHTKQSAPHSESLVLERDIDGAQQRRPTKSLGTRRLELHNPPSKVPRSVEPTSTLSAQSKVTPGGAVKSALTRFFNRGGKEFDPYVVDLGIFKFGRPRLEPGVDGIVVPVVDEQPSTVIAYSLSSHEYANQFKHFSRAEGPIPDRERSLSPEEHRRADAAAFSPGESGESRSRREASRSPTSATGAPHSSGFDARRDIERRMLMRNKSHIKHTFRDYDEKRQQTCKFVCTTYWATQFHAVREAFLAPASPGKGESSDASATSWSLSNLDVEKCYVQSLASAYSWAASGGKSGASFARTTDERFVIKCISRTELQMFLDCATAYFEYLSKAFFHGLPTVLCKIVGVYQIGYHNRITGKRNMEQVAVMQNIFYKRNIVKIFDLKGSMRGRFAAQVLSRKDGSRQNESLDPSAPRRRSSDNMSDTDSRGGTDNSDFEGGSTVGEDGRARGRSSGTLLDGDFQEFTHGRPMPLNDRAKALFHMSILNDTLFLSIINVLDYSILVGIDEENMELVVGIIDFMRQYDILKQMERVGKSLPMVVGSEAPTIIQPPLYKARFTNAMERYFMTVPSKWTTI